MSSQDMRGVETIRYLEDRLLPGWYYRCLDAVAGIGRSLQFIKTPEPHLDNPLRIFPCEHVLVALELLHGLFDALQQMSGTSKAKTTQIESDRIVVAQERTVWEMIKVHPGFEEIYP